MSIVNTAIHLKKSGISGNVPSYLSVGEVALNYADGKLYYNNYLNQISYITNQDTFGSVLANGTLLVSTTPTDILTLTPNTNIKITGNATGKDIYFDLANSIQLTGNVEANYVIVDSTLYSGLATRSATPLPNLIAQFTGNTSSYVQVNAQNINPNGSADYVATADVGNDTVFYIDMGIQGSQETYGNFKPLDGYLYVQGNTGQLGGNLIIGTTSGTPGLQTRIVSGGYNDNNVIVTFDANTTNIIANLAVSGSISSPTITNIQNEVVAAFNQANAAYALANTGGGGGGGGGGSSSAMNYMQIYEYPIGDYGSITDPIMSYGGLGDIIAIYDMKIDPFSYAVIPIDLGYLS